MLTLVIVGKPSGPVYYAFDLLHANGADLTSKPLIARKAEGSRPLRTKADMKQSWALGWWVGRFLAYC